MADLFADALEMLAEELAEHASQTVTYRRGALTVSLSATLGRVLLRTLDARGNVKVERTDRDFLINAAELVLGGVEKTPERGDKIDATLGGRTHRFEVLPFDSEPAWRYADTHHVRLRVHTKHRGPV